MFPSVTTIFTRWGLACLFHSLCDAPHTSLGPNPWILSKRQVDLVPKRGVSPGVMSLWSAVLEITHLSITIPDLYISSSSSFIINLWDPIDRRRYPQTCPDKPWAPCSCWDRGRGRWGGSCSLGRSRAPGCPGWFPLLGQCFGWWHGWKDAPSEEMTVKL